MTDTEPPRDEDDLDERLSRPPEALTRSLAGLEGAILVLGAGGKMGPSLTRMAKRANPERRVIAVSRWSDANAAQRLRDEGVEVISADLLDPSDLDNLPDAQSVVFMAGQKFGTSGNPAQTWALNAAVPAYVARRFSRARIAVFSTGNVYPLTPLDQGGSREDDAPAPVGEYAWSCLARERIFSAQAQRGTPVSIIRLNYAHDLRYGVLTDLASRITRREPIDLRMAYVNVIWQGDANAFALATLLSASSPEPRVVNVAGRETLRVAHLAEELGRRLDVAPQFSGDEGNDALLSNADRLGEVLAFDPLPLATLLDWVADWVKRGGRLLAKPTNFERRDGRF